MKHNRILATILTCVLVAAAIFIGLQGKPVSRDDSLYLTDKAGVISPAVAQQFVALQKQNAPRLSVAIVRSTGRLSTADYCETLWENWRMGTGDMLLLMVTGQQDYYFGYSTNATYASLLDYNFDLLMERYLEPGFAAGDYEEALLTFAGGVTAVLNSADFNHGALYPEDYYDVSAGTGSGVILLVALVILVIVVVAVVSAGSIGKGSARRTVYHTPTPPRAHRTTTAYRPVSPPVSRPASRPRTTISTRPRTSGSRSSFGGGSRSRGGFGGGGRSSGGFGGGGRSGGMGGRGRR